MTLTDSFAQVQQVIADAGLDGWLLYDFRGINPIAHSLVGLPGMVTRRYFCFVPREGVPIALTHAIEQGPWHNWPTNWRKEVYSTWQTLESQLRDVVGGKRIAMEYSPGDAVPYLDRIPAGVIEMVRAAGATIESSGDLVTRFYAVWTDEQRAAHERAAEHIARIANESFTLAAEHARSRDPISEYALQQHILREFAALDLHTDHGPNVSVGANAANPHYEPTETETALIREGDIVLIDLWAHEPNGIYADQTWMASIGTPKERDLKIWKAVAGARDAAITFLREQLAKGAVVKGADVDDVAANFIREHGFGDYILHRTGHSIDVRDLHGSGPHIDNRETRDERTLLPGVGFSIEPGIYLAGDVGMRAEVNAFIDGTELVITPREIQRDLIVV